MEAVFWLVLPINLPAFVFLKLFTLSFGWSYPYLNHFKCNTGWSKETVNCNFSLMELKSTKNDLPQSTQFWRNPGRRVFFHLAFLGHQNIKTSLNFLEKNNSGRPFFALFSSAREKLQFTVSLNHHVWKVRIWKKKKESMKHFWKSPLLAETLDPTWDERPSGTGVRVDTTGKVRFPNPREAGRHTHTKCRVACYWSKHLKHLNAH